jgi:hypothetical protein
VLISTPLKWKDVSYMVEIRGKIPKEEANEFRRLAMKKFGYGKGSLSKALEEAVNSWIKKCENERSE